MPNTTNHNFRSEAVTEILSNKPSFLIRYGISFFFAILCFVGFVCWFIQYPDTVNAKALLTSINPPKPIVNNIGGKLIKLFIKENDSVTVGQTIGYMEAIGKHEEVNSVSKNVDGIQLLLNENKTELISSLFDKNFTQLGELQANYQTFSAAFLSFKNYISSGFYLRKKNMLAVDIVNIKRLHTNLFEQKGLNEEDLTLTQKTYEANKSLNEDKVIADVEFRNEKSKLIGKKLALPQISGSIISNEAQQNEKQKEIAELENNIAQQKTIFQQALHTFKSQIEDWQKKYVLAAPISGKISFATFVQENQQLQANQTICYINPVNSAYYAQIFIPQTNFGKITEGQKVLLKFPSYPFQEYGALNGTIDFISHIPTDSGYLAKVILTNGLNTSYKKQLQYREGLTAQGEIITKAMRLLERFYYNIVNQVSK